MSYNRKTIDEYQLHVNYGGGWEYELAEETMREARLRQKEYRENCPQYPTKVVKKRVRKVTWQEWLQACDMNPEDAPYLPILPEWEHFPIVVAIRNWEQETNQCYDHRKEQN